MHFHPKLSFKFKLLPALAGALAIALAVPLFGQSRQNPGLQLSARELAFLARCTLSRIDTSWVFEKLSEADPDRGLVFGRRRIGAFLGGAQSARYDLPFFVCAGELAGTNWRYLNEATDERGLPYGGIAASIADLSGLPLFAERQGSQRFSNETNYYNPEIIRWARTNMIPDPKDTVYGMVSYQQIYDEVFARAFRILHRTDTYLRARHSGSKQSRFEVYLKLYADGDYEERKALRNEFSAVYTDRFLGREKDPYNYYFSAGHAATFWLRRGMDDTADEVRALLAEILQRYDADELKS